MYTRVLFVSILKS